MKKIPNSHASYLFISSILFNLAYFFPSYCGIFAVTFFFFIYKILIDSKTSLSKISLLGFLWGIFSFGGHSIWLLILLWQKSNASLLQSLLIYSVFIFYLSLTSAVWFATSNFFIKRTDKFIFKISIFLIASFAYFYFLINYAGIILGERVVYPFISPFIPLASYKWFLKLITHLSLLLSLIAPTYFKKHLYQEGSSFKNNIYYLQPDSKKSHLSCPAVAGQRIYQKLTKIRKNKALSLIVAPESTFPFPLNKHPEVVEMWQNAIGDNVYFLIGSLREDKGEFYQSTYLISQGRIILNYDKQTRVPFVESLFGLWKNFNWMNKLFLNEKKQICKPSLQKKYFDLSLNMSSESILAPRITPMICSDFFWSTDEDLCKDFKQGEESLILASINDSWFCSYFRRLMKNYAHLKAVLLNVPILYVSHFEMEFFDK